MADNPVTSGELARALDALIMRESELDLLPEDITVARLMDKTGWEKKRARRTLQKWTDEGKMEYVGKRKDQGAHGQMVDAWRIAPSHNG